MKFALVTLFALLGVAHARTIDGISLEDITSYNYLEKYGLPLADKIRQSEEAHQSRIVGGTPVIAGAIPYQAGLLAQFSIGQGVCGGSLVSVNRVLTAAHCWYDGVYQATSFVVVLGSALLFSGGNRQNTNQIVMHQDWNPFLARNDIAVIYLPSSVPLSNIIGVIALPSGSQLGESFISDLATASGYGRTADGAHGAITTGQFLSQVSPLTIITNNVCAWTFGGYVSDSNICTSGADGRNTCSGDSGGPLTIQRNGRPLLVGVVSYGSTAGCEAGFPSAYARVTSFIDFINQNL